MSDARDAAPIVGPDGLSYRLAQELSGLGSWSWNVTTNRVVWSEDILALWGFAPGEFQGELAQVTGRIHADDLEDWQESVRACVEDGAEHRIEYRIVLPDGEERWMAAYGDAVRGEDGRAERLFGVVMDVTRRKRAEAELVASRDFLDTVVDQSPFPMWVADPDGLTLRTNRALRQTLNLSDGQIVGQYRVLEDRNLERHGVMAEVRAVFSECRPARFSLPWKAELAGDVLFEGARDLDIDVAMFPVVAADGSLRCVVCQWSDVTEQTRTVRRLRQALDEANSLREQLVQSQKMEAIGVLAGGVAHDFNNLLTVIGSCAEFLARGLRDGDPMSQDVRAIQNAAASARRITAQLLAFGRRQALEPRVVSLGSIVRGLEPMLGRLLGEDVRLDIHLSDDAGNVRIDPNQFENVIVNLAANAREAMPAGGRLTIETSAVTLDELAGRCHDGLPAGDYILLAVSDTGVGMDVETRAHVFEPFFTQKGRERSSGLGLSTVHGIVGQSGGAITVYSEPDQGATFKVYLPRVQEELSDEEPRRPRPAVGGDETILLVEDDEVVRLVTRRALRGYGYRVMDAADGGEALLLCERHEGAIHLLLTDVVMPRLSGRQVADRLTSLRPELRVLHMSGYTDNTIVHHGILEPGIHFIAKPFSADGLARKVRDVLDQ